MRGTAPPENTSVSIPHRTEVFAAVFDCTGPMRQSYRRTRIAFCDRDVDKDDTDHIRVAEPHQRLARGLGCRTLYQPPFAAASSPRK